MARQGKMRSLAMAAGRIGSWPAIAEWQIEPVSTGALGLGMKHDWGWRHYKLKLNEVRDFTLCCVFSLSLSLFSR